MELYHGSASRVVWPEIGLCRPHNDYGQGFYCTQSRELAMEWACNRPGRDGFCNTYELDTAGLVVVDLDADPNGVLTWLAVLMEHRVFDMEWNVAQAKERFIERYRVDLSGTDVVCGYRADDSYFSIARAFAMGVITDKQAADALRFGDLGRQVMIRSQSAFDALTFCGAEHAAASVWYPRWASRDASARRAFRQMREVDGGVQGRRIFELVGD